MLIPPHSRLVHGLTECRLPNYQSLGNDVEGLPARSSRFSCIKWTKIEQGKVRIVQTYYNTLAGQSFQCQGPCGSLSVFS